MGLELVDPRNPGLTLHELPTPTLVLGAFQRAASAVIQPEGAPALRRRHSGGPTLWAGPGTLHLLLTLPRPDALVACDPPRLLNRYVRPLLRGLTRLGAPAHYGGRDWVSVAHRPAAWVGFAHDETSGASLFEAFVALDHPFVPPPSLLAYPPRRLDPFLGKTPATFAALLGRAPDAGRTAEAIVEAFRREYGAGSFREGDLELERTLPLAHDQRPPFAALEEDVIGFVGARLGQGGGLGGDFFASEGVARGLDAALVSLPADASTETIERAIREALDGAAGGTIEGLRDPTCLRRVVQAAQAAQTTQAATGGVVALRRRVPRRAAAA
ncbi:MAG: hypothetical protein MUF34_10055 [Polyangiaceae bacterium]|jgi:hypothetical protein|nr:hypothetical protein [Polyangiaceae bacterium]